ncbi:MAG: 7-cyano-7-deazaguanine synthase QueC [Deltaproteobacteria bacterium]|nr:7-cyano-7-deazaguanine synthase QueC [Deltaproteobacteria bacterium]
MSVLVVLSGGQDSTTCLFWAKEQFPGEDIHALTFDYGQKHAVELNAARKIGKLAGVASHEFVTLGKVLAGTSPLVNSDEEVGQYDSAEELPGGVEPTFVPARNILFLTIAANRAHCLGVEDIITGVCQEDFGGYFDCRRVFIDRMENALSQGIYGVETKLAIHTPLMYMTKKESVEFAIRIPGALHALAYSHTCYNGQNPPCGKCHACILRQKGFDEGNCLDPLFFDAEQVDALAKFNPLDLKDPIVKESEGTEGMEVHG